MKQKRGSAIPWTIGGIVFLILVLLMVLYFQGLLIPAGANQAKTQACAASIATRSIALAKQLDSPLNCETEDLEISDIDQQKIKKEIADEMIRCWDMLGKGEFNIFKRESFSSKTHCMICTRITFKEGVQKKNPAIYDFTKYLIEEKAPEKSGITYWNYINPGAQISSMKQDPNVIYTNKEYMIIYAESDSSTWFGTTAGATAGGIAAGVIGAAGGAIIGTFVVPGAGTLAGLVTGAKIGAIVGGASGLLLGGVAGGTVGSLEQTRIEAQKHGGYDIFYGFAPMDPDVLSSLNCQRIETIP